MIRWMRRGLRDSQPGMSAALGALDAIVNPAAARASDELREQHERVMPAPTPGDRLLREGKVVIAPAGRTDEQRAVEPHVEPDRS
jgi:hypothetical protein